MRNFIKVAGLVCLLTCNPGHPLEAKTKLAPAAPVSSPKIVMLRFFVSDVEWAEKFYRTVFAMTTVQKMGKNVRILIFPGGATPGIILIQSAEEASMNGSFIVQVPDLKATMALAAANGATLKNTKYEQNMGGIAAKSSHFADPDGNVIEVLQIGGPIAK